MANMIQTTGKRKTALARAVIKKGKGSLKINNLLIDEYLKNSLLSLKLKEPLIISGLDGKYDINVSVYGGGQSSQVDAIRQAIARGLIEITGSDDLKEQFLDYDRALVISDTRFKETKKPNNSHARASRQKSYR